MLFLLLVLVESMVGVLFGDHLVVVVDLDLGCHVVGRFSILEWLCNLMLLLLVLLLVHGEKQCFIVFACEVTQTNQS